LTITGTFFSQSTEQLAFLDVEMAEESVAMVTYGKHAFSIMDKSRQWLAFSAKQKRWSCFQ
jgi:hypothetical protein